MDVTETLSTPLASASYLASCCPSRSASRVSYTRLSDGIQSESH